MNVVSWGKTHRSALVIIPPETVWGPIQALRQKYDRQFQRWMPHINLLYPFVGEEFFPEAVEVIAKAVAGIPAFTLQLARFRCFVHNRGTATVWLEPEPTEAVRGLQAVLQSAFPQCDDVTRFPEGYTPHLSIGQSTAQGVENFVARLQKDWQPFQFLVSELALISRPEDGPFAVRFTVQLSFPLKTEAKGPV